jgi:hypothetical protein
MAAEIVAFCVAEPCQHFNPADGGSMFHRNIDICPQSDTVSQPEDHTQFQHHNDISRTLWRLGTQIPRWVLRSLSGSMMVVVWHQQLYEK